MARFGRGWTVCLLRSLQREISCYCLRLFFSISVMSNLLQEIESQISGAKKTVARENVGVVREISDGVAKIEGLTDVEKNKRKQ